MSYDGSCYKIQLPNSIEKTWRRFDLIKVFTMVLGMYSNSMDLVFSTAFGIIGNVEFKEGAFHKPELFVWYQEHPVSFIDAPLSSAVQ